MDKLVKISIIVASLLAGFGVFYHFVIHLPGVEDQRIEKERRAASQYHACMLDARQHHRTNWANECKSHSKSKQADCSLPISIADRLLKALEGQEARCLAEAKMFQ